MEKDKKQKMKKLGVLLIIHCMIIPFVILSMGAYLTSIKYVFIVISIAVLWILIFGRIYVKKIMKLQKQMDAGEVHIRHNK